MKVERRSTVRMNCHRGGNQRVEDQAGAFGDPDRAWKKEALERHHQFPKRQLNTLGIRGVRETSQIATYALVELDDNIIISDERSSKYWPRYVGADELARMSDWHALPTDWWTLSYADFLAARRPLIAGVIRAGYQKLAGTGS